MERQPTAAFPDQYFAADVVNIFLTGASGTLGGELAAKMLAAGHAVAALVRKGRDISGNDGRRLATCPFAEPGLAPGKVNIVAGDVRLPGLGLNESILQSLRGQTNLVIHCAAVTDFNASEVLYREVNVEGTGNVLAAFPDARILHVSTAYVCGLKDGPIAEFPRDADYGFANGYERSKAESEALVLAAGDRAVIARPSIVVGAHSNGAIHRFDNFYQVFRLIAEGRITQLPVAEHATLDFVPIDHVAAAILDIIDHWGGAAGTIIHVTSGKAIPAAMLSEAIARFEHLDPPLLIAPEFFSVETLPKLERRLYANAAVFYASYFQRCPQFVNENLDRLSGRSCPPIDLDVLERMIGYCINAGFLRRARGLA